MFPGVGIAGTLLAEVVAGEYGGDWRESSACDWARAVGSLIMGRMTTK